MNNKVLSRAARQRRNLAAGALVLLAAAGTAWALTAPGKIAYIDGKVEVIRNGSKTPVPAEVGMSLYYGDQVQTGRGKCQLNLTASGILRLSSNSKCWFPTEENKSGPVGVWNMLAGKTAKNVEQLSTDEVFEVREASLVAGVSDATPAENDAAPNHGQAVEEWKQGRRQEIERLRAEGNAKLDAIRAELKQHEGKPVTRRCPSCGSNGPHRWTSDGWECNCGTTVLLASDYPTSQGTYNGVKEYYRDRIAAIEQQIR